MSKSNYDQSKCRFRSTKKRKKKRLAKPSAGWAKLFAFNQLNGDDGSSLLQAGQGRGGGQALAGSPLTWVISWHKTGSMAVGQAQSQPAQLYLQSQPYMFLHGQPDQSSPFSKNPHYPTQLFLGQYEHHGQARQSSEWSTPCDHEDYEDHDEDHDDDEDLEALPSHTPGPGTGGIWHVVYSGGAHSCGPINRRYLWDAYNLGSGGVRNEPGERQGNFRGTPGSTWL